MKKQIAILGSTGSIGKTTLNIITQNKKDFNIELLTTNKNIKELERQVRKFKVRNIIVIDYDKYLIFKNKFKKNKKIRVFNDFNNLNNIFKSKLDYVMSSITGLSGLEPTLKIIEHTKRIAIANKETIICAWNLVKNKLDNHKTEFVPIDSEHFSIWKLLNGFNTSGVEKIYITASGGPFLNLSKKKIK